MRETRGVCDAPWGVANAVVARLEIKYDELGESFKAPEGAVNSGRVKGGDATGRDVQCVVFLGVDLRVRIIEVINADGETSQHRCGVGYARRCRGVRESKAGVPLERLGQERRVCIPLAEEGTANLEGGGCCALGVGLGQGPDECMCRGVGGGGGRRRIACNCMTNTRPPHTAPRHNAGNTRRT